jgi:hypothetical protein
MQPQFSTTASPAVSKGNPECAYSLIALTLVQEGGESMMQHDHTKKK